jgi:hypothetical protein
VQQLSNPAQDQKAGGSTSFSCAEQVQLALGPEIAWSLLTAGWQCLSPVCSQAGLPLTAVLTGASHLKTLIEALKQANLLTA